MKFHPCLGIFFSVNSLNFVKIKRQLKRMAKTSNSFGVFEASKEQNTFTRTRGVFYSSGKGNWKTLRKLTFCK